MRNVQVGDGHLAHVGVGLAKYIVVVDNLFNMTLDRNGEIARRHCEQFCHEEHLEMELNNKANNTVSLELVELMLMDEYQHREQTVEYIKVAQWEAGKMFAEKRCLCRN